MKDNGMTKKIACRFRNELMRLKDFLPFFLSLAMTIALSAPSRAESLKLVGFGDSLMAGYQLPPEDAFPARLE